MTAIRQHKTLNEESLGEKFETIIQNIPDGNITLLEILEIFEDDGLLLLSIFLALIFLGANFHSWCKYRLWYSHPLDRGGASVQPTSLASGQNRQPDNFGAKPGKRIKQGTGLGSTGSRKSPFLIDFSR